LVRRAHFPFLKTVDDFNFTYQSTVRLNVLGSALSPDFVTDGRSLIFGGKPGRGKTHLAVAIAYRAIQNGFDAYFTTAAALIDDLSAAFRAGELAQALPMYTHPAVLVVDEVGYLTYGTDAANMLFHVVNERHRRKRAMIFTTNKSLKGWGGVLHDEDLAQATIDRVLERGRLFRLDGPSIRTLHVNLDDALNQGSDQDVEVARISGITRPEFPEPTGAFALSHKWWRRDAEFAYTRTRFCVSRCHSPTWLSTRVASNQELDDRMQRPTHDIHRRNAVPNRLMFDRLLVDLLRRGRIHMALPIALIEKATVKKTDALSRFPSVF
jgi:DNA replication protein DnaC